MCTHSIIDLYICVSNLATFNTQYKRILIGISNLAIHWTLNIKEYWLVLPIWLHSTLNIKKYWLAQTCMHLGCSTIGDIKKSEDKLRAFASTMESLAMNTKGRKIMRLADNEKLDKAVYPWFVQKRSQDMPVSGPFFVRKLHNFMLSYMIIWSHPFRQVGGCFGISVSTMELGNPLYRERKFHPMFLL